MEFVNNKTEITNVDININILIIFTHSSFYLSKFIYRTIFINDYDKFKEEQHFLNSDLFVSYGKIKNKTVKFIFQFVPLYNQYRWDLKRHLRKYLSRSDKYVYLLFYDSPFTFEESKRFYSEIIDVYRMLNIGDPISILVRYNYELVLDPNKEYVNEEEALEYKDKNNLYFAHIGCTEKYETGIKELLNTIFNKYIKKYNI